MKQAGFKAPARDLCQASQRDYSGDAKRRGAARWWPHAKAATGPSWPLGCTGGSDREPSLVAIHSQRGYTITVPHD